MPRKANDKPEPGKRPAAAAARTVRRAPRGVLRATQGVVARFPAYSRGDARRGFSRRRRPRVGSPAKVAGAGGAAQSLARIPPAWMLLFTRIWLSPCGGWWPPGWLPALAGQERPLDWSGGLRPAPGAGEGRHGAGGGAQSPIRTPSPPARMLLLTRIWLSPCGGCRPPGWLPAGAGQERPCDGVRRRRRGAGVLATTDPSRRSGRRGDVAARADPGVHLHLSVSAGQGFSMIPPARMPLFVCIFLLQRHGLWMTPPARMPLFVCICFSPWLGWAADVATRPDGAFHAHRTLSAFRVG
jgi:hypothetical protein